MAIKYRSIYVDRPKALDIGKECVSHTSVVLKSENNAMGLDKQNSVFSFNYGRLISLARTF